MHRRIVEQRDRGDAVLIVSSELDEIYALSDRIAVIYEGKITGFRDPDVPAAELGRLMARGADTAPAEGTAFGEDDAPSRTPAPSRASARPGPGPPPLRRNREHRTPVAAHRRGGGKPRESAAYVRASL